MNLKQRNIAAAKALGLTNISTMHDFVLYGSITVDGGDCGMFTLTNPACMNRVIEHFKIDVTWDAKLNIWMAYQCLPVEGSRNEYKTKNESSGPDRDTAIMKCVTKCLEVESE